MSRCAYLVGTFARSRLLRLLCTRASVLSLRRSLDQVFSFSVFGCSHLAKVLNNEFGQN